MEAKYQFVAKAQNKDLETHCLHGASRILSANKRNRQYKADFVQDGAYVRKLHSQSLCSHMKEV
jgi:hypothetical protein